MYFASLVRTDIFEYNHLRPNPSGLKRINIFYVRWKHMPIEVHTHSPFSNPNGTTQFGYMIFKFKNAFHVTVFLKFGISIG